MLTKLMPDQISSSWDVIKYAIEESLPPTVGESPNKMNNILTALLCGRLQCWASYEREEGNTRFEGIVITQVMHDDASDTRSLLIYCLYGYEEADKKSWSSGFKTLVKFATSQDCTRIIGYSNVPSLIKLAERLGGGAKYSFISVPLFNN